VRLPHDASPHRTAKPNKDTRTEPPAELTLGDVARRRTRGRSGVRCWVRRAGAAGISLLCDRVISRSDPVCSTTLRRRSTLASIGHILSGRQ